MYIYIYIYIYSISLSLFGRSRAQTIHHDPVVVVAIARRRRGQRRSLNSRSPWACKNKTKTMGKYTSVMYIIYTNVYTYILYHNILYYIIIYYIISYFILLCNMSFKYIIRYYIILFYTIYIILNDIPLYLYVYIYIHMICVKSLIPSRVNVGRYASDSLPHLRTSDVWNWSGQCSKPLLLDAIL